MNLFLMRQSMTQVPDAMIEAAKVDGADMFRICWQVVMPNQKPALMTVIIFSFQAAWNIQGGTLVFSESLKTLPTVVQQAGESRRGNGSRRVHAGAADRHLYAGTAAGHRNHGTFRNQGLKGG